MLVVDASFVITASLTAEGFARLPKRNTFAPPLLWSEATSVLHEMLWRKEISPALAETALSRMSQAPIRMRRPARLQQEAWQIATRLGWAKTYDAEYVALARMLACPLLTIDAKLAARAAGEARILGAEQL